MRGIVGAGYDTPRPIQAQTIPAALKGRDVLGLAQTGTGKTAAFAVPILERLLAGEKAPSPRALIVAPTRELAIQIDEEVMRLAKFCYLRSTTVFGGVSQGKQVRALKNRPDVLVACPGRLLDLMQQGYVKLDRVETLVLDEADHMFDMGFLPAIKKIVNAVPARRQNLLFSATMPPEIRRLADKILNEPHVAELAHSAPAETIEHALYPIASTRKVELLDHLLKADDFRSAIVFLRTKHRARRLAQQLDKMGYSAVALQGNMSQGQRDRAMGGFRAGRYKILVATDIAARGIDVAAVSHVVNFDMPGTPDAYTHRIGRTGRAELSGKAYTFVTTEDISDVRALERKIKMEIPRRTVPGFEGTSIPAAGAPGGGRSPRSGSKPGRGPKQGGGTRRGPARPGTKGGTARSRPARTEQPSKPAASKGSGGGAAFGAGVSDGASRSDTGGARPPAKPRNRNRRSKNREGNALPPEGSRRSRGGGGQRGGSGR